MTKKELAHKIYENQNDFTIAQTEDILETIMDTIKSTLESGDKVSLNGFGTFQTKERPAHEGRNPATGATINVAAKTTLRFKPSKQLKEAVNSTKVNA